MNPGYKAISILFFLIFPNFIVAQNSILLKNEVFHFFSNTETPDKFELIAQGDSVLTSTVSFNIISSGGDTLFSDLYKPTDFLNKYYYINNPEPFELEQKILDKLKSVFDEIQFRSPAIKDEDFFDRDYSDTELWNEIKSDQTAVRFNLIINGISKDYAYSKKQKKVVLIFSCC